MEFFLGPLQHVDGSSGWLALDYCNSRKQLHITTVARYPLIFFTRQMMGSTHTAIAIVVILLTIVSRTCKCNGCNGLWPISYGEEADCELFTMHATVRDGPTRYNANRWLHHSALSTLSGHKQTAQFVTTLLSAKVDRKRERETSESRGNSAGRSRKLDRWIELPSEHFFMSFCMIKGEITHFYRTAAADASTLFVARH